MDVANDVVATVVIDGDVTIGAVVSDDVAAVVSVVIL